MAPEPPCAICRRAARGFLWFDPTGRSPPRPTASFCGMPCQFFWTRLAARSAPGVVDLTEQERAAIRAAVRPIAEVMGEIGWGTRLQDLSEAQVLTLIEVTVDAFQDAMRALAENAVQDEVPCSGPQRASALGTR